MAKTKAWVLSHKPRDDIKLDGPEQTFKLTDIEVPELNDDHLLIKNLYFSNEPAQRGWFDPDVDPERLYITPIQVGEPITSYALASVIESKSSEFKKGDTVLAQTSWCETAVVPSTACQPANDLPGGLSKTHYLGALGLTGLTAYFGITRVGEAKPDDIVVVSGAAGATGSMVVQIAKHLIGCKKVIGVAGTDEKCRWVESIGADLCLNYKSKTFYSDLKNETPAPAFANIYFDNVGGELLDFMFTRLALHGRVVCCGAISGYNTATERTYGLKNWFDVIVMRIRCQGFVVLDYQKEFPEAIETFRKAIAEGKLKIDEKSETIVKARFEDVPATYMKLFDGSNQGKLVTSLEA